VDLLVKVKELQPVEFPRLRPRTVVMGYAQLNRDPVLLDAVLAAGVRVVGFETVRGPDGGLPLLAPMSRIAGRLAPFAGAQALATDRGGAGVLLASGEGLPAAEVVVVGAGASGSEAARVAARLGCRVTVFSRGEPRLRALASALAAERLAVDAHPLAGNRARFAEAIASADLVIGAVLEPGALSPKLITRAMLRTMRAGRALVDIGIDQGGIAETSRMTSLARPTYVEEGVVHYAVPNMPSLVARSATQALAAAVLPYVRRIAALGIEAAVAADAGLAAGVMTWDGAVAHAGLARDRGRPLHPAPWRVAACAP
jgi:alanine dehydrogenase